LTVNVLEVDDQGIPKAASFSMPVSLDDSSLRWLRWDWRSKTYHTFDAPDVGEKVRFIGGFAD
jgi:hypothetical protein